MTNPAAEIVMGPCPGCDAWGLQFNTDDISVAEVQRIVAEHAHDECPGLMSALISSSFNAGPNRSFDILVGMDIYLVDPDRSASG